MDTKFFKYSNLIISLIICDLFNSCVEQEKFRGVLKIAEIVPTVKKITLIKNKLSTCLTFFPIQ